MFGIGDIVQDNSEYASEGIGIVVKLWQTNSDNIVDIMWIEYDQPPQSLYLHWAKSNLTILARSNN
jgi:hypothetical protein